MFSQQFISRTTSSPRPSKPRNQTNMSDPLFVALLRFPGFPELVRSIGGSRKLPCFGGEIGKICLKQRTALETRPWCRPRDSWRTSEQQASICGSSFLLEWMPTICDAEFRDGVRRKRSRGLLRRRGHGMGPDVKKAFWCAKFVYPLIQAFACIILQVKASLPLHRSCPHKSTPGRPTSATFCYFRYHRYYR